MGIISDHKYAQNGALKMKTGVLDHPSNCWLCKLEGKHNHTASRPSNSTQKTKNETRTKSSFPLSFKCNSDSALILKCHQSLITKINDNLFIQITANYHVSALSVLPDTRKYCVWFGPFLVAHHLVSCTSLPVAEWISNSSEMSPWYCMKYNGFSQTAARKKLKIVME